jgi:sugar phosphate isomerase/epimerase
MAIRLGVAMGFPADDPEAWALAVRARGYRAAVCPVRPGADGDTINAFARAAAAQDVVISEVGAWSNPLSDDPAERDAAVAKCVAGLELAEAIGANCCVNIAGSRGAQWDGPDPKNLTEETFERIVETTRAIIDAVRPTRSCYALEAMPWVFPTGPDDYRRLIDAIDRGPAFGVHLDPVNMVWSPPRFFQNGALIRECFESLGPHIRNCHAKDTRMPNSLTVRLEECAPGQGSLDYPTFLRCLDALGHDRRVGLIIEHLKTPEEYDAAAAHVRAVAAAEGIATE